MEAKDWFNAAFGALGEYCGSFRDSVLERDRIQRDCINLDRQLNRQRKILLAPHQ